MLKNLVVYKILEPINLNKKKEKFKENQFKPCDLQEKTSIGWEKVKSGMEDFIYEAMGFNLLRIVKEDKILPNEVVKAEFESRVEELEEKEGRKLKKTEKATIKDQIFSELLPRAFSKYSHTLILINKDYIMVDCGSAKAAEEALAFLRKTLETLPVKPIEINNEMNKVLLNDKELEKLTALDEFDISDGEGTISCKKTHYQTEEIQNLLKDKYVKKLAFDFDEKATFVLTEEGFIKRLKLSDDEKEKMEDKNAQFDADFVLFSNTAIEIIESVLKNFQKEE